MSMITCVVFLRMFWNFMKRGGSHSFLVGTISNVLVMEIGWTDVGSGGYILVSCARSNTSFVIEHFIKKFVHTTPMYRMNGNSSELYMLTYYHVGICILFWQVDKTSFEVSSCYLPWVCFKKNKLFLYWKVLHFKSVLYCVSLICTFFTLYRLHIAFQMMTECWGEETYIFESKINFNWN
jgi:hypothetical protein